MPSRERLKGLDAAVHGLIGAYKRRKNITSQFAKQAAIISRRIDILEKMSPTDWERFLTNSQEAICRGQRHSVSHIEDALAVICVAAYKTLGLRPYPVQIMGALAIDQGYLAELATGEGKTLTVGLAAILAGWRRKPCHILTANDYLATRDAEEIKPLYEYCGLTVESCLEAHKPEERKELYVSDIVYVTPKILLADVLRDVLAKRDPNVDASGLCLPRGLHTAIVDEADSMLIDESVTPLIISAPKEIPGLHDAVLWANNFIRDMDEHVDYSVDHDRQTIQLTQKAKHRLSLQKDQIHPQWKSSERLTDLVLQALKVNHFFKHGVQYLVQDDKVVLIDEFTGRLTAERSLSGGLHQAIEAKEGVTLTNPNFPLAQMTFQNFFRSFKKLACTTGTAQEAAKEFFYIYETPVIRIPTNRPRQVITEPLRLFRNTKMKLNAIVELAESLRSQNVPTLIGVRSVTDSHELSKLMKNRGIPHYVLNAIEHEREAEIIQKAGQAGQITIATNMAGRGVDIKVPNSILEKGGLHVIVSEANDSARVDRQLMGRCGRQGNPGRVHQFLSLEDTIFKRQLSQLQLKMLALAVVLPQRVQQPLLRHTLLHCQTQFERRSYKSRKALLNNEEWLDSALPFNQAK